MKTKALSIMKLLLSFLLLLPVSTLMAHVTISEVISTMPEHIVPYLQEEQRAEISNFAKSKDTLTLKNALDGTTSVDISGSDFAEIRLNEITGMQIKLLPCNDSTEIICLVKTIGSPVKESTVQFFTSDWKEIEGDFNLPQTGDAEALLDLFVERPDSITEDTFMDLKSYIDPVLINVEVSKTEHVLTYSISLPFVTGDALDKVKSITRQNTFKWDGDKFKKC